MVFRIYLTKLKLPQKVFKTIQNLKENLSSTKKSSWLKFIVSKTNLKEAKLEKEEGQFLSPETATELLEN